MRGSLAPVRIPDEQKPIVGYGNPAKKLKRFTPEKDFVLDCVRARNASYRKHCASAFGDQEYSSMGDRHLRHYFMRDSKRKDLKKVGIIDRNGNIVPSRQIKRVDKILGPKKEFDLRNSLEKLASHSKDSGRSYGIEKSDM